MLLLLMKLQGLCAPLLLSWPVAVLLLLLVKLRQSPR
jgi:hypothetical protein